MSHRANRRKRGTGVPDRSYKVIGDLKEPLAFEQYVLETMIDHKRQISFIAVEVFDKPPRKKTDSFVYAFECLVREVYTDESGCFRVNATAVSTGKWVSITVSSNKVTVRSSTERPTA